MEDGVTQLDLVFTGRQLVVDPQNLWKSKLHLLEYSAIRLKKIRVFLINSCNILWNTLPYVAIAFADFFNWNRVKVRYCDGASFAGDSENKVPNTILFPKIYDFVMIFLRLLA